MQRAGRALWAEWTKLRTVPSTGWTLLSAVVMTAAVGALVSWDLTPPNCERSDPSCDFDLTKLSLSGVYIGQAAVVVLAVLAVTAEYEAGMIRTTLAACPRRLTVLAAKLMVLTSVVLLVSVASVLGSLVVGREILARGGFTRAGGYRPLLLGDGPTLRAYGGTVLYLGLVAIIALGIGFVVRHTGGAVTLVLGFLYLAPVITIAVSDPRWREWIEQVSPMTAGLSIQATLRLDALPISPWRGLGVVALYAAASTAAAAVALRFRDA
ncbi:ABC transporter permease [Kribbella sp. VKM Ac-2568]|uniref:ABC transporter permease n=1 Tax=Kribbella sp. VKM Ac-2568 TaxID=2512219 RepID=UPI00104D7BDE|nr:ABC transporter permease [Kribbella sp. VKM Ac-2568]TCM37268.1 ABC-2 type transport system permease protein [Kribbella sp. VKM Ac-2568]